jgi:hypothetical protein
MSAKLLADVALLLAVATGAAAIGYGWGVAHEVRDSAVRITKAESKVANANGDRDAALHALTEVRLKLDKQKQDLENARYLAQAALDARDALQTQLTTATRTRTAATQKAAHESPACADLVRLPVCPVVAQRLWGIQANEPAGRPH